MFKTYTDFTATCQFTMDVSRVTGDEYPGPGLVYDGRYYITPVHPVGASASDPHVWHLRLGPDEFVGSLPELESRLYLYAAVDQGW